MDRSSPAGSESLSSPLVLAAPIMVTETSPLICVGGGDEGGVKPATGFVGKRMDGGSFKVLSTLLFSLLL